MYCGFSSPQSSNWAVRGIFFQVHNHSSMKATVSVGAAEDALEDTVAYNLESSEGHYPRQISHQP
jgi:hypothetical protein